MSRPGAALEEASDVGRLSRVLHVVIDHTDEPHADRYGGIPTNVDDSLQLRGVDGVEIVQRSFVDRVVIVRQEVGPGPNRGHLFRRMAVSGIARVGRHPEARGPSLGDPGLLTSGDLGDVIVLDAREVPHQPGNGVGAGVGPECERCLVEPEQGAVDVLPDSAESVAENGSGVHGTDGRSDGPAQRRLTGAVRSIGIEERRARLGIRQSLAASGPDVASVAGAAVGLHSSDPSSVFLAAWARIDGFLASDLEHEMYEHRGLVRMLGMRRTMFVVPRHLAAVMQSACTRALAPPERRRLIGMLEDQGIASDGDAWLEEVESAVIAALEARGPATAVELTEDVPELARKLRFGEGRKWGGAVGVSTRVLFLLATDGEIVRARPKGTWVSSQYRWARTVRWLGEPLPEIETGEARRELVARWLRAYGPGTLTDLKWWTGWGVRQTRQSVDEAGAVEVEIDGEVGYVASDDLDPVEEPDPWVALLPGLDSTVMGWKQRAWYLGDHQPQLFDRNGNAGPTVWSDGRVVGGWAQRPNGEIAFRLLDDVGTETETSITEEAARLEAWLGEVRVIPRFRTPLEKEILDG